VTDPKSLARGLQVLNANVVEVGRAVSELATILGSTIALTDGCENPSVTLTEALMRALDDAKENGLLSSPIFDVLQQALQSGVNASPPPDRRTRLTIVQGEKRTA
jgi:hypothetical protein